MWVAFELWLLAFRRSDNSAQQRDRGTLVWLNIVIYASVTAAVVLSSHRVGHLNLTPMVRWLGLLLLVAGLGYRIWAIRVLRQFFSVDVAIHSGQRLVENGPYRYVRHPAYSGSLLAFAGLAICMSSWISAVVLLVPIGLVFLWRIATEERALTTAFPGEYPEYAQRTFRLLPGIY
jgi:protein-S-isoprenylcysteine O-methyltransferase